MQSQMDIGIIQYETVIYKDIKNKAAVYINEDWRQRSWWYYEARSGCLNPVIRYIRDKDDNIIAAYTKRMELGKNKPTEVIIEYENDEYGNWIRRTAKYVRRRRQDTFREDTREIFYREERMEN
jgi:hypothetical protein